MAERVRQIAHPTPPPPPDTTPESNISVRSVALTMIAIGVTMYVLHWAREVFIPIVLSILISYALEPVVAWMTRIRLPRAAAAAVVVTLITGLVGYGVRSEEHTSELQSQSNLVCRLLLEKKKKKQKI